MPDATGLELIAQAVRAELGDEAVVGTSFFREQATLQVAPERVHDVIGYLREADEPWDILMSVHGCDYLPEEPRLGIHYELLSMERVDRLRVKTRVGVDDPLDARSDARLGRVSAGGRVPDEVEHHGDIVLE